MKTLFRGLPVMVHDTHTKRRRSEKSSDFHKILYTGADFEVDERHVIKSIKVALDRLRVQQNVFLVSEIFIQICYLFKSYTRQVCRRRYESRRSQKPYLLHLQKKNKIRRKTIFNMTV